jgi:hypothetical protein
MMKLPGRLGLAASAVGLVGGIAAVNHSVAADDMIAFGKEKLQVNFGYYRPNFTTSAAAGFQSATPPGNINGENDLALSNSLGVGRIDGHWRFAERHKIFVGYYKLDRDASLVLNRNIGPIKIPALGVNDTILAGSNVRAESNIPVYILAYDYSFYKTNTVEIAGRIGVNTLKYGLTISGTLNTQNNGVLTGATAGSEFTAPLPVIGISGNWAPSPRWRVKGNLAGFKAKISGVDASVADASLTAEYLLHRNFGIGAGYSLLRVSGDVTKPDYFGSLSWRTGGWQLYGSLLY